MKVWPEAEPLTNFKDVAVICHSEESLDDKLRKPAKGGRVPMDTIAQQVAMKKLRSGARGSAPTPAADKDDSPGEVARSLSAAWDQWHAFTLPTGRLLNSTQQRRLCHSSLDSMDCSCTL